MNTRIIERDEVIDRIAHQLNERFPAAGITVTSGLDHRQRIKVWIIWTGDPSTDEVAEICKPWQDSNDVAGLDGFDYLERLADGSVRTHRDETSPTEKAQRNAA